MSRKLPIAETAVQAVTFAIRHVWPTIRLGWLPLIAFIALLGFGVMTILSGVPGLLESFEAIWEEMMAQYAAAGDPGVYRMSEEDMTAILENNIGDADLARIALGGLICLLGWLVFVPLSTVLFRIAAGDIEAPDGFFYWKWGGREKRLVATYILYMIVVQGALYAVELFGVILAEQFARSGDVTLSWVPVVLPIVFFIITIWITMRTILIIPASAIENDMNFIDAVRATGGNFFRLLGSFILLIIMIIAACLAFGIVMFVGAILFGALGMNIGSETSAGYTFGVISFVAFMGLSVFFMVAMQLVSFGWLGGAWAALRRDNVRSCEAGGPGEGGVCEV